MRSQAKPQEPKVTGRGRGGWLSLSSLMVARGWGPVLPSCLGLALPCGALGTGPFAEGVFLLGILSASPSQPSLSPLSSVPSCPALAPRGARTAELSSPTGTGLGVRPELWSSGPCHVLVSPVAGTPVSVTSAPLPLGWDRRKPRAAPVPDPASEKRRCARVRLRPPLGRLHCQVANRRGSVLGEPGLSELGCLPPPPRPPQDLRKGQGPWRAGAGARCRTLMTLGLCSTTRR